MVTYTDLFSDKEIVKIIRSPFFDNNISIEIVRILVKSIYNSRKNNIDIKNIFSIEELDKKVINRDSFSEETKYKAYDLISNFVLYFKELTDYEIFVKLKKKFISDKINTYAVTRELNKLRMKK